MDGIEEIKANYNRHRNTARVGTIIFKNKYGHMVKIRSTTRRVQIKYRVEDLVLSMLPYFPVDEYEYGSVGIRTDDYTYSRRIGADHHPHKDENDKIFNLTKED